MCFRGAKGDNDARPVIADGHSALDGEGDCFATERLWRILFTIQTSWMGSCAHFAGLF
jgi:hypothetical protein